MLRFWTALALAFSLALLTACTGGPQPDPPGGTLRDAGRTDGGLAASDSGPAGDSGGGGDADSGPPADIDAGSAADGAVPMPDGAPTDGSPTDAALDAGPPATCESYCECMFSDRARCLSPGDGRSRELCRMNCESTFTADQLACRAYQCSLADGPKSYECQYALGVGMCE